MPTQLAKRLHVVTALDHAKPELRIAFEPFYVIARELLPLFRKHWKELAVYKHAIPLDPDWDRYLQMSVQGILQVLTVRADDELVGYIFTLVASHLHYKTTLHGIVDMFWLDPRFRKGWFPVKMFRENERHLVKLGCKRIYIQEKLHFKNSNERRVRMIFRRLGYKAIDVAYSKLLED